MTNRKTATKAELLTYLDTTAGRAKFEDHCGAPGRTPETYLREYSHRPGIVHHLAIDTGFYVDRDGKEYWEN